MTVRARTAVIVALVAAATVAEVFQHRARWQPVYDVAAAPAPEALPVPVAGAPPRSLVDTWGAPRSGGRTHQGIDIFARRGTAVVSPVPGIVMHVGQDALGGNVVRVLGPGRQLHYFAHLERPAEGVRRWQVVRPGDVLGYVGTTGNARGTPPHLHYGIYVVGRAINPFPLLRTAVAP